MLLAVAANEKEHGRCPGIEGSGVVVGGLQKYTFSNKNEVILNKTPVS